MSTIVHVFENLLVETNKYKKMVFFRIWCVTGRKRSIGTQSATAMRDAVEFVIRGQYSIRKAALWYSLEFSTLRRYVERAKSGGIKSCVPNYSCRKVFSEKEGSKVEEYLIKASRLHHGLTGSCKWENCRINWQSKQGNESPKAGRRTRHLEKIGLADLWREQRIFHFEGQKPEALHDPLASTELTWKTFLIIWRKSCRSTLSHLMTYIIAMRQVAGCTTVQKISNHKVVALKKDKQVGQVTSGEKGVLVTVLCTVNAAGNTVPPIHSVLSSSLQVPDDKWSSTRDTWCSKSKWVDDN